MKENSNGKLMEFENQLRFKVDSKKYHKRFIKVLKFFR